MPIVPNQIQPALADQSSPSVQVTEALNPQDADLYARFFKVMGDPTRIRLLYLLLDAPAEGRVVSNLVNALGIAQGRVSTHLACLRWCGLVACERSGKQMFYRLADPRIREILRLGGAVMHDHAAGLASCSVIG
jgi:ArsR family transcriptional regulator, cadmium/lead-responsive transcriptional repressor